MQDLSGQAVIVAGGATGIGAATARTLAGAGARVLIGDIDGAAAERLARTISGDGAEVVACPFDLADDGSIDRLVQSAVATFGGLDHIHINALDQRLVVGDKDVLDIDMDVFDRAIATNLRGYVSCTRAALPEILKRGGGSIIYTSSGAAFAGEPVRVAYGICKAGINALTRHVAARWGKQHVRANAVVPGWVLTEVAREHALDRYEAAAKVLPSHRLGTPEDIAAMVAFLMSADGEWITGQCYSVDGGGQMR